MMTHVIEHLVTGLQNDLSMKKEESVARRKSEAQLYRLLAEMVETERKYVQDLEEACEYYLPLAGIVSHRKIQSLDRRQLKKNKRNLSQCSSVTTSCSSQESFNGLSLERGENISPAE
jgi:hypothetical protein